MNNFIIESESCEYCSREYIESESMKLVGTPNGQKKTEAIHRIIHGAYRASYKPVVKLPCREQRHGNQANHYICAEHLYKMIDAIKEYEDTATGKI